MFAFRHRCIHRNIYTESYAHTHICEILYLCIYTNMIFTASPPPQSSSGTVFEVGKLRGVVSSASSASVQELKIESLRIGQSDEGLKTVVLGFRA